MTTLEIPGRPVPKKRPRLGRRGTYTPKETRAYEELVAWHARRARVRFSEPVHVSIRLWSEKPLRGDIDNYAKSILDGLQLGEAIENDRQVVLLTIQFVIGHDNKTVVEIRPEAAA